MEIVEFMMTLITEPLDFIGGAIFRQGVGIVIYFFIHSNLNNNLEFNLYTL